MRERRKLYWLAGIAAALALAAPAHTEEEEEGPSPPDNGRSILEMCTAKDPETETRCLTFIAIFLSTWSATIETARRDKVPTDRLATYCLPRGATLGKVRDAIVTGLSAVAPSRQEQGDILLIEILRTAYPCPADASPARN